MVNAEVSALSIVQLSTANFRKQTRRSSKTYPTTMLGLLTPDAPTLMSERTKVVRAKAESPRGAGLPKRRWLYRSTEEISTLLD